jgi:solute carrier family 66, member 3
MSSVLQMISDTLSIITISLCLILKVPQILNLYKLKSAKGMNLPGLFLELTRYKFCSPATFKQ